MAGSTVVRPKLCTACKTCELQCALAHSTANDMIEAAALDPSPEARIKLRQAKKVVVPVLCSHCENPPCVAACPSGALQKNGDGSPTLLDEGKCSGTGACIEACPVGALEMTREGKIVLKCDQCIERQKDGLVPACVDGCPTGALEWHAGLIRYEIDADGTIVDARMVPPTSQNQRELEDDLRGILECSLGLSDDALSHRLEQTIRNYDPCISCATHFLRLEVRRS